MDSCEPHRRHRACASVLQMAQTQFSSEVVRAKWYSGQWNAVPCYTLVQFSTAGRGAKLLGPEADGARSWC